MSRYRIEMPLGMRDLVRHLPPQLKRKLKAALRSIADDPHGPKELKEELAGLRSYRIGRSRVIYRVKGSVVEIITFGPRLNIYERAAAELSLSLKKKTD
jgi:mRNA-degrading endonuclease RelE of RelBE toxin-antitoxin system